MHMFNQVFTSSRQVGSHRLIELTARLKEAPSIYIPVIPTGVS
jgi:hypothetical protein